MHQGFRAFVLLLSMTCATLPAQQPQSRAEAIQEQRAATFRSPYKSDTDPVERAIEWAYDTGTYDILRYGWHGFHPTTGGLINRSGAAFGLQYLRRDMGPLRATLRSSGRISWRGYQLYDFEIGMPKLADDHAYADVYLRYRNYPGVNYYGPGPNSRKTGGTAYRLEDATFDFSMGVKPARILRMGIVGGYLRTNVGPDDDLRFVSTHLVYSPLVTPGIDRQSNFLRGGGLVQIDWRDNPAGPRRGGHYYSRFDYYHDPGHKFAGFRRVTAEVQQFVPFTNGKRVIAARAKSIMSFDNAGQVVPFYLQPSLGGADDLRGFLPYRFYDKNSFVMNAEYRWELMTTVEAALFADAGKVYSRPGLLNFSRLEKSYGFGFRFRTPTGGIFMRTDLAFSREGVQVSIVFNDIFAAPQVRTGNEITPPPGRLP